MGGGAEEWFGGGDWGGGGQEGEADGIRGGGE